MNRRSFLAVVSGAFAAAVAAPALALVEPKRLEIGRWYFVEMKVMSERSELRIDGETVLTGYYPPQPDSLPFIVGFKWIREKGQELTIHELALAIIGAVTVNSQHYDFVPPGSCDDLYCNVALFAERSCPLPDPGYFHQKGLKPSRLPS